MRRLNRRSSTRGRRGSMYLLILGVSVILMVIGLSAVTLARVNTRSVAGDNHWAEAQVLAFSGAEHALATIRSTDNWRTKFGSSETTVKLTQGTFRWRLVDEADGDLADDAAEPFVIVARGQLNDAAYAVGLCCAVDSNAMEALRCGLHSGGEVNLWASRKLKVRNGPVSSNNALKVDYKSLLNGDVEAASVSGSGKITGTVTTPAPAKAMPSEGVFDTYRQAATKINPGDLISRKVLGPGCNPWGAPNPRGIYYVDAPGRYLMIWDARIYGTLVVRCRRLYVYQNVLMHSSRKNQPTLIVDGEAMIYVTSSSKGLREGGSNPNFNPVGAPYKGRVDNDRKDKYPSELQGLVHVKGDLWLGGTTLVRGTILCEGRTYLYGDNEIIHDAKISENPPLGYTSGAGRIIPQSWKRIID